MNIEKQIEFDKIKEMWINLATTECAKEKIREVSIYLNENELRKQLRDTTNSRNLMEISQSGDKASPAESTAGWGVLSASFCVLSQFQRILCICPHLHIVRGILYCC